MTVSRRDRGSFRDPFADLVSLEEYRQRKHAAAAEVSQAPYQVMMWFPVWLYVPYSPATDQAIGQ